MIGLRVAHVLSNLQVSAAASAAINLMRWLQANGHATVLFSDDGQRAADLEMASLERYAYKSRTTTWWMGGKRRVLKDMKTWQPDVIHVHQASCLAHFCSVAQGLGVPVVASIQTREPPVDIEQLRHPAIGLMVVPSEALRAHYVGRLGFSRDQVAALPYGLDLDRYPEVTPPGEIRRIGAIGTADEVFGLDVFVRALAVLAGRGRSLEGQIIGGGDREKLVGLIDDLALTGRVQVLDASPRTGEQLRNLDLFVYPCRQDVLILTVLKAMACGRPVIASAVGSMSEWIRDGHSGLLVPPGDETALADAIERCCASPDLAGEFGRNGRTYVAEHHDLALVGEAVHALYRNVLRTVVDPGSRVDTVRAYRRASEAKAALDD